MKPSALAFTVAALLAAPAIAQPAQGSAPRLSGGDLFMDAALLPKLIVILLLVAMAAALVMAVRKVIAGPNLSGGSAFVSNLRWGGPLLGLLGATYGATNMFIGITNVPNATLGQVAPGVAEAFFLAAVGLLAGVVGVAAQWVIDSRIDRQVLKT